MLLTCCPLTIPPSVCLFLLLFYNRIKRIELPFFYGMINGAKLYMFRRAKNTRLHQMYHFLCGFEQYWLEQHV